MPTTDRRDLAVAVTDALRSGDEPWAALARRIGWTRQKLHHARQGGLSIGAVVTFATGRGASVLAMPGAAFATPPRPDAADYEDAELLEEDRTAYARACVHGAQALLDAATAAWGDDDPDGQERARDELGRLLDGARRWLGAAQ